jgi:hypothetical protein
LRRARHAQCCAQRLRGGVPHIAQLRAGRKCGTSGGRRPSAKRRSAASYSAACQRATRCRASQ